MLLLAKCNARTTHTTSRTESLNPLISRALKALEDRFHCSKRRTKLLLEKALKKPCCSASAAAFFFLSFFFFLCLALVQAGAEDAELALSSY